MKLSLFTPSTLTLKVATRSPPSFNPDAILPTVTTPVCACVAVTLLWQTEQASGVGLAVRSSPAGPVEPAAPAAPVAPVAPTAPESPDPHPRKSNGMIKSIEDIRTANLFDMKRTLLFSKLKPDFSHGDILCVSPPVRKHLLSSCGYLKKSALAGKSTVLSGSFSEA